MSWLARQAPKHFHAIVHVTILCLSVSRIARLSWCDCKNWVSLTSQMMYPHLIEMRSCSSRLASDMLQLVTFYPKSCCIFVCVAGTLFSLNKSTSEYSGLNNTRAELLFSQILDMDLDSTLHKVVQIRRPMNAKGYYLAMSVQASEEVTMTVVWLIASFSLWFPSPYTIPSQNVYVPVLHDLKSYNEIQVSISMSIVPR